MQKKGQALILVLGVLAVAGIMAVSFAFTMRFEIKAASNYMESVRAGYIAEAGVLYAKQILKEDDEKIDSLEDAWHTTFAGSDVDNDEDGTADSRWIELLDEEGRSFARYAILIKDELGLVNINTAKDHNTSPLKVTEGWAPNEVSLIKFLNTLKAAEPEAVFKEILDYRYGQDGKPGIADFDDNSNRQILESDGLDNNADGVVDEINEGIDEPLEFLSEDPYGDDRPILMLDEISKLKSIPKDSIPRLSSFLTTYSADKNVDFQGRLRTDINTIDPLGLSIILEESGVNEAWQKALNIKDSLDEDFSQSSVTKPFMRLPMSNKGPIGDWVWRGNRYQSDVKGGKGLEFTWINVKKGDYYIGIFGIENEMVGDVTINEWTQKSVKHGELFRVPFGPISITDGILKGSIQNNGPEGTTCYFSYLELYPRYGQEGFSAQEFRGIEGIRLNEIMVRPIINSVVSKNQNPGGDWVWQGDHFENSNPKGGKQGEGQWKWTGIQDGDYYLRVFAGANGQEVGDVEVEGARQASMMDGEQFSKHKTITVSNGQFTIRIQNNRPSGATYFKSIQLSQQPDAEYIELINLTPREVDLSGWSIEGSSKEAWPASIPLGTTIGPWKHLVLAVDKDDTQLGISGNGISIRSVWGKVNSCQLHFAGSITEESDLLQDEAMPGGNFITLKDRDGHIVDKVEYLASSVSDYRSLEKGDPTFIRDSNGNGIDDSWENSLAIKGGTPGEENDNKGMEEKIGEEIIRHSVKEVLVRNKNFASIAEAGDVSLSLKQWRKIPLEDVAKVADRFTIYSIRLEAEGNEKEGQWTLLRRNAPLTDCFESGKIDDQGIWLWDKKDRLEDGSYILKIYGTEGEALSASIHLADGTWTDFTPELTPGVDGSILFGEIEIGTEGMRSTPSETLEIKLKNSSRTAVSHFDFIRLEPKNLIDGRLNINTAPIEALQCLPGVDAGIAQKIISNRPYGNKNGLGLGIGDLLAWDILPGNEEERLKLFKKISNLVTFHSNLFRIIVTAQTLQDGKVLAEKKVWTTFER